MPRAKKLQKVDTLSCAGYHIIINFDPNLLNFTAVFNGETYADPSVGGLKSTLEAAIADISNDIQWVPVIRVLLDNRETGKPSAQLTLTLTRFYLALRSDGNLVKAAWDLSISERLTNSRHISHLVVEAVLQEGVITLPARYIDIFVIWLLPYSEELWLRLSHLVTIIQTVGDRVFQLFQNPESLTEVDLITTVLHRVEAGDQK